MRRKINKEEIIDDLIYFSISAFVSLLLVFLFDIHHSFYQPSLFPLKFIFKSKIPYLIGGVCGGILGLFLIKVFIFALEKGTFRKIKRILKGKLS